MVAASTSRLYLTQGEFETCLECLMIRMPVVANSVGLLSFVESFRFSTQVFLCTGFVLCDNAVCDATLQQIISIVDDSCSMLEN